MQAVIMNCSTHMHSHSSSSFPLEQELAAWSEVRSIHFCRDLQACSAWRFSKHTCFHFPSEGSSLWPSWSLILSWAFPEGWQARREWVLAHSHLENSVVRLIEKCENIRGFVEAEEWMLGRGLGSQRGFCRKQRCLNSRQFCLKIHPYSWAHPENVQWSW